MYQITWMVTDRCNSRCVMCNTWKRKPRPEFTVDEFSMIVDRWGKYKPKYICLCGGEPFLRDDLWLLYKKLNGLDIGVTSATNGIATEKIVEQEKKILDFRKNLDICVSIDGSKKVHDSLRGKGFYDSAMKTIRELGKIGVKINLSSTFCGLNVSEVDFIRKLGEKINGYVFYCYYSQEGEIFNEPCNKKCEMNEEQKGYFTKKMKEIGKENFHAWLLYKYLSGNPLVAKPNNLLLITPNLDVYPCGQAPGGWKMGNLREYDYSIPKLLKNGYPFNVCTKCYNPVCAPSVAPLHLKAYWMIKKTFEMKSKDSS